jgi:hypothetical protein
MAIGVFGLQVAYKLKRLEVMSTTNTHGWFGGGVISGPSVKSTVDRIDFSNDTGTANTRSPLSLARYGLAATGNSNYGWFCGGLDASVTPSATVDRIDFSNDSSTALGRGPLSFARSFRVPGATGNSNYGWLGYGFIQGIPPSPLSMVERIDFSNDSATASLRGQLSTLRYALAATGNSNYGWFGGGRTPGGPLAIVDRIDFSNDSPTASPRSLLSSARYSLAATGNSNYGWFGGGNPTANPSLFSYVDRVDFSNDTTDILSRGPLSSPTGINHLAATGNSNYGWFGGGTTPAPVSTIDRIDFSNDSVTATPRGPLSLARGNLGATSGQAKGPAIKLQKAGNYGWFGGGFSFPGGGSYSTVNRIDFSNDTATIATRGTLTLISSGNGKYLLAATGNSNYGWFGGGYTPTTPSAGNTEVSTVDRIDFSNDSPIASIRGPLTSTRQSLSATGNSNYGWFGGGRTPGGPLATVDRINFSNDSVAAIQRGLLSISRGFLAATGNSNYGWFGGGYKQASPNNINYSRVDRIDFSNDSSTISVRGSLSSSSPPGRGFLAATGNSNYGWFGGGKTDVPYTTLATIDRIDFSNDSITASVRGSLSSARYNLAATGNSNYGWFGGGSSPTPATVNTVDRIDFSNDSVSASPRGSLSQGRSSLAATSNTPT